MHACMDAVKILIVSSQPILGETTPSVYSCLSIILWCLAYPNQAKGGLSHIGAYL